MCYEVFFLGDENILEVIEVMAGCAIVQLYKMPLNCTL
jgi:hypothetical protein